MYGQLPCIPRRIGTNPARALGMFQSQRIASRKGKQEIEEWEAGFTSPRHGDIQGFLLP